MVKEEPKGTQIQGSMLEEGGFRSQNKQGWVTGVWDVHGHGLANGGNI